MPDLSFVGVENENLRKLLNEIEEMKRSTSSDRKKPHKLVLLLAIISLFEQRKLLENKIYFDTTLELAFKDIFILIGKDDDWCQPAPPYFHLRSSGFWHHKIISGREEAYQKINTSGGGKKRIVENIEYAYLSEYAYDVFCNPNLRNILRDHIVSLINPDYVYKGSIAQPLSEHTKKEYKEKTKEGYMKQRIGTMFHEKFALNRDALCQVMNALLPSSDIGILPGYSIAQFFQEKTNLGPNYIKSVPKYAIGAGLLDFEYRLTPFGKIAWKYDQRFDQPSTQWLMHYFLSAPHGPGPLFWNKLISKYFLPDTQFSSEEVVDFLSENIETAKGNAIVEESLNATKTIFLGTYTKTDGLGNLALISGIENRYQVNYPDNPPIWAMAVAFIDYCQAIYPDVSVISLNNILDESDFGKVFMVGVRRINLMLNQLQEIGYVNLYTSVPPYGVALLRTDVMMLLEKMYGNEELD